MTDLGASLSVEVDVLRNPCGGKGATVLVVLDGKVSAPDVAALERRVGAVLGDRAVDVLVCDVAAVTEPDVVTVDALARLQLTARRRHGRLRVCRASGELRELVGLVGLGDVLLDPDHPG